MLRKQLQPDGCRHHLKVAFQGGVQLTAVHNHSFSALARHLLKRERVADHIASKLATTFYHSRGHTPCCLRENPNALRIRVRRVFVTYWV